MCVPPHLSYLLLAGNLGGLGEGVVVGLYEDQVGGRRVNRQLPRGVLKGRGHLVEDHTQFLQRQDPAAHTNTTEMTIKTNFPVKKPRKNIHRETAVDVQTSPESVGSYGDDALRALLRGEAGGVVEHVVGERGEVEARLEGV